MLEGFGSSLRKTTREYVYVPMFVSFKQNVHSTLLITQLSMLQ